MGKKDKDKKSKNSAKAASKKPSPQSIRSVNVPGTDSAVYNAVPGDGTDTEDTINPADGGGSVNVSPQTKASKRGKEKKKGKKKGKKNDPPVTTDDDDDSTTELKRKPSPVVAPLPQLSREEYAFFEMVKNGDVDEVTAFLRSDGFKDININKTDKTGYTVLHVAVRRQDEAMVRLLLQQPGIRLYDTLLHSIKENNVEITKILLELYDRASSEEQKLRFMSSLGTTDNNQQDLSALVSTTSGVTVAPAVSPISARSGVKSSIRMKTRSGMGPPSGTGVKSRRGSDSKTKPKKTPIVSVVPHVDEEDEADEMPFDSEFPPVITPLMLAAQEGCYPLMELFYARDERLENSEFAHNVSCECDICVKLDGDQDMTRAYQRYHLFKALTQPDYICFIARKEKVDPVNYAIQKIIKVRQIIDRDVAFNTLFQGFEEQLEQFMSKMLELCRNTTETEIFLSPKDAEGKERLPHLYPRLWYTVGLELKHFVAQPNAQNIVYKIWATDDWPDWDTYGWIYRVFNIAIRIVAFPLIALILLVAQDTGIGRTLGAPVSRFLTYIGSYIFFLMLVGVQALFPYQRCNDQEPYYQIDDNDCKQRGPPTIGTEWPIVIFVLGFYMSMLKRHSVSWYWSMRWNWFELISQVLFTTTFGCWAWAWIWTQMPENHELLTATDRLMWPHDCAEVFGECFLALAFLLASGRILRFFTVHPELGPIQIALGKQIIDFISTSLILFVVIFAFSSGMMSLYMPYKDFRGKDAEDHKREKLQDDSFQGIQNAMKTFFFILYEHGGPDTTKLLIWSVKNDTGDEEEVHHKYTEFTGLFLFMAYHVIGATMLFSMLSGYFAQTVEEVMENVDVEWKYARTELYLTFIKDTVLPPPFNLLPTLSALANSAKFMTLLGKKQDPKAACSFRQCCYITSNTKTEKWRKLMQGYRKLILLLIFRYRNLREEEKGEEEATKDDVLEIGEELAEIKAMLKKSKGENVGSEGDDDDDYPGGGGGAGIVASTASGKSGWAKTKYMVDAGGSTYLKNTDRHERGGGGGDGGASGSRPAGGGGAGSSQLNAKSAPVVTAQPSVTSSKPGPSTVPSSGVAPASKGKSDKMSLMFIAQMTPKRTSGLVDYSGSREVDPIEVTNNNAEVSAKCTTCSVNPSKVPAITPTQFFDAMTQPTPKRGSGVADFSGAGGEYDYTQPRRGSRGGGGMERNAGLEDFSSAGQGSSENTYKTPPRSTNQLLDMEPTPKKAAGIVDYTGNAPVNSNKPPISQAYRTSPKSTNQYLQNTEPAPKRNSGLADYTGGGGPRTSGDYHEHRRGSRGGGGLERNAGLEDFSGAGEGSSENTYRTPPRSTNQLLDMEPTPKKAAGIVDYTGNAPVNSSKPPTSQANRISPKSTNQYLQKTEPTPKRNSGFVDYTGGFPPTNYQTSDDYHEHRRGSRGGGGLERNAGLEDFSGAGQGSSENTNRTPPRSTNQFLDMEPTPKKPAGIVDYTGNAPINNNKPPNSQANRISPKSTNQYLQKTEPTPKRNSGLVDYTGGFPPTNYQTSDDYHEHHRGSRGGGGLERHAGLEDFSGPGDVDSAFRSPPQSAVNYLDIQPTPKRPSGLIDPIGASNNFRETVRDTRPVQGKLPPSGVGQSSNYQLYDMVMPTPTKGTGIIDVNSVTQARGGQSYIDANSNKTTTLPSEKIWDALDGVTEIKFKQPKQDKYGQEIYSPSNSPNMTPPTMARAPTTPIPLRFDSDEDTTAATDGSSRANDDYRNTREPPQGAYSQYTPLPGGFQLKDSQYSYR